MQSEGRPRFESDLISAMYRQMTGSYESRIDRKCCWLVGVNCETEHSFKFLLAISPNTTPNSATKS